MARNQFKLVLLFSHDVSCVPYVVRNVSTQQINHISALVFLRYAGGKRFVMVRKILEVKEVTRIAEEAALTRLMDKECDSGRNFE